jgi:hypothetical protein
VGGSGDLGDICTLTFSASQCSRDPLGPANAGLVQRPQLQWLESAMWPLKVSLKLYDYYSTMLTSS